MEKYCKGNIHVSGKTIFVKCGFGDGCLGAPVRLAAAARTARTVLP